eukprot:CAMPEP_0184995444 /NCGR_PEP_ID=MMETSP1098-20130426/52837_1 /TAXON_ID=89044 /ORGANISM="Spumella elongata, Strain CCAP 955/1" /LENGTH=209 /DNA_ID=CAMNT_0027521719 /DNA_START=202 /DNA_END=831 /DNA_ORIENTATION=+
MKFLPDQEVLPENYGTGMFFQKGDLKEINRSPLVKKIFHAFPEGIKGVFLGRDFITVTKDSEHSWNFLKPMVYSAVLDFYAEGLPIVEENPLVSDTTVLDTDSEIVATIKELMETRVRPSVQEDGGDIFYEGFDDTTGIVKVRLAGSCVGCPSSSVTLRNGVENMLMHYIPEVKGILDVTGLELPDADNLGDSTTSKDMKLEFRPEVVA